MRNRPLRNKTVNGRCASLDNRAVDRLLWTISMPRGPKWTADEDAQIRAAVRANREDGISAQWPEWKRGQRYARRLASVARNIGRTPDAVRKRAQRIGAESYLMRAKIPERLRAEREREAAADVSSPDASPDEARRILRQIRKVTG